MQRQHDPCPPSSLVRAEHVDPPKDTVHPESCGLPTNLPSEQLQMRSSRWFSPSRHSTASSVRLVIDGVLVALGGVLVALGGTHCVVGTRNTSGMNNGTALISRDETSTGMVINRVTADDPLLPRSTTSEMGVVIVTTIVGENGCAMVNTLVATNGATMGTPVGTPIGVGVTVGVPVGTLVGV